MPKGFVSNIATLTAATAVRLSDLLVAEGYAGRMLGKFLEIDDQALTDLRYGDSSSLSGTTGRPISGINNGILTRTASGPNGAIDPGSIWLFSTAGGEIGITFESF